MFVMERIEQVNGWTVERIGRSLSDGLDGLAESERFQRRLRKG
ncbi:hypothetical protein [Bacillus sp. M6-12]|nr:hypothetical protein [Bacillus sp. M6-12]